MSCAKSKKKQVRLTLILIKPPCRVLCRRPSVKEKKTLSEKRPGAGRLPTQSCTLYFSHLTELCRSAGEGTVPALCGSLFCHQKKGRRLICYSHSRVTTLMLDFHSLRRNFCNLNFTDMCGDVCFLL